MEATKTNPALYINVEDGQLVGQNAKYVDDLLRAGKAEFREHCRVTHSRFEISEEDDLPCDFAGFKISGDMVKGFTVTQNQYFKNV